MGGLVKDTEEPAWKAWLAHVALVRFVTRHSYVRGVDGACHPPHAPLCTQHMHSACGSPPKLHPPPPPLSPNPNSNPLTPNLTLALSL